jgi:small GTP-binding protein
MTHMTHNQDENIRFTLHDSHNPSKRTKVELRRDEVTVDSLIRIANKELGLKTACKIFCDNGDELLKESLLKNNEHLFVSDSELLDTSHEVFHICMLGAGAVGKSALTLQFIQGQFVADYDPTIEDAYRKHISIDGNSLLLDVLDTAGQEDFLALRTSWMRNKDGFVLAFSIIERKSYEDLLAFYDQLCEVYEDDIPPFVLVGNKADLDTPEAIAHHKGCYKRQVSYGEASELAAKWGAVRYIETSAKTGFHVRNMFGGLVREIVSVNYREQVMIDKQNNKTWKKICQIL